MADNIYGAETTPLDIGDPLDLRSATTILARTGTTHIFQRQVAKHMLRGRAGGQA